MKHNHPFAEKLREGASGYKVLTLVDAAAMLRTIADELEAFEYKRQQEALTLSEASRESGYSVAHLSRMISEGKMESVATGRITMVRRGDLPKKRPQSTGGPDLLGKVGTGYGESPK